MLEKSHPDPCPVGPSTYQIRLKGHLGTEWIPWFEGVSIRLEPSGETLLLAVVADQAALFGLLRKVRDLGMTLVSVNWINSEKQSF